MSAARSNAKQEKAETLYNGRPHDGIGFRLQSLLRSSQKNKQNEERQNI
jgi:hypothetical protein